MKGPDVLLNNLSATIRRRQKLAEDLGLTDADYLEWTRWELIESLQGENVAPVDIQRLAKEIRDTTVTINALRGGIGIKDLEIDLVTDDA